MEKNTNATPITIVSVEGGHPPQNQTTSAQVQDPTKASCSTLKAAQVPLSIREPKSVCCCDQSLNST
eukprot:1226384-Rhodomonas_salina.1